MTENNKETTTERVDFDGDGKLDTKTTTVERVDDDKDGKVDYVKTEVVVVDDLDNVLGTKLDIKSTNVDASTSYELDTVSANEESRMLLEQIKELEEKIKCPSVQHLGSMQDYAELFKKAQEYISKAGDKNINLVVDTSVLEKFAAEAKVYSEMFSEVEIKFSRLSTVNDTELLKKIKGYLVDIALMYENIQKFHTTITTTAILQIPDSIKTVTELLNNVSESIECSLPYLEYFADATTLLSEEQKARAELSEGDKASIVAAIRSLDLWLDMINNEANVSMSGNAYIQEFKAKIAEFDSYTNRLKSVIGKVADKMQKWKNGEF